MGIGAEIIEKLFSDFNTPEALLEHLKKSQPVEQQWAAQRLAFYVKERNIGIVTQGIEKKQAQQLKMEYFPTLQDAIDACFERYNKKLKVLIVKDADFLLLKVK